MLKRFQELCFSQPPELATSEILRSMWSNNSFVMIIVEIACNPLEWRQFRRKQLLNQQALTLTPVSHFCFTGIKALSFSSDVLSFAA